MALGGGNGGGRRGWLVGGGWLVVFLCCVSCASRIEACNCSIVSLVDDSIFITLPMLLYTLSAAARLISCSAFDRPMSAFSVRPVIVTCSPFGKLIVIEVDADTALILGHGKLRTACRIDSIVACLFAGTSHACSVLALMPGSACSAITVLFWFNACNQATGSIGSRRNVDNMFCHCHAFAFHFACTAWHFGKSVPPHLSSTGSRHHPGCILVPQCLHPGASALKAYTSLSSVYLYHTVSRPLSSRRLIGHVILQNGQWMCVPTDSACVASVASAGGDGIFGTIGAFACAGGAFRAGGAFSAGGAFACAGGAFACAGDGIFGTKGGAFSFALGAGGGGAFILGFTAGISCIAAVMTPTGGDIRGCFLGMVGWVVGGGCELLLVVDATKVEKRADKSTRGGVGPTNAQTKSTASFGNFTGVLPPGFSDISTGGCQSDAGLQSPVFKSCTTYGRMCGDQTSSSGSRNISTLTQVPPPFFALTAFIIRSIDGIAWL